MSPYALFFLLLLFLGGAGYGVHEATKGGGSPSFSCRA